jgi:DNA/RNA-binding domain of Phe-tRNA-synthetase-like protein
MLIVHNELGDKMNDCSLGLLIMEGVKNTAYNDCFAAIKHNLGSSLRGKYGQAARSELKALYPMDIYVSYYKQFGYTCHILPQLESFIKGETVPDGLPLVEAMFMAELKNMLLTAGHDLDKIKGSLRFIVTTGQESYTSISGKDVTAVPGDFALSDQESVISSILRGPDLRTAITEQTSRVLYTVYAPSGVKQQLIFQHLNDIESFVRTFSEESITSLKHVSDQSRPM